MFAYACLSICVCGEELFGSHSALLCMCTRLSKNWISLYPPAHLLHSACSSLGLCLPPLRASRSLFARALAHRPLHCKLWFDNFRNLVPYRTWFIYPILVHQSVSCSSDRVLMWFRKSTMHACIHPYIHACMYTLTKIHTHPHTYQVHERRSGGRGRRCCRSFLCVPVFRSSPTHSTPPPFLPSHLCSLSLHLPFTLSLSLPSLIPPKNSLLVKAKVPIASKFSHSFSSCKCHRQGHPRSRLRI